MVYKLVCFDLSGVLMDNDEHVWNIIHDSLGIDLEERNKSKNDFLEGRITYQEWVAHNVNLWAQKQVTKDDLVNTLNDLQIREGALEVLQKLKNNNYRIGLISGGLNFVFEKVFKQHQMLFNHVFINKITFGDSALIASGTATEYDMGGKGEGLKHMAELEGLELDKCVFVGCSDNNYEALKEAGLGIAFNPKTDRIREVADIIVEGDNLMSILPHIMNN